MKNNTYAQIFVIYLRYLLGFAFVFASIVKIQGLRFTGTSGIENPINSAWHYFETMYQSGVYWRFIGIGQFIAGALLLTQRYAKLGAITYLPIIANIFFVTISYYFAYTPVITGLMFVSTLFLIYWDWDSFKIILNKTPVIENKKRLEHDTTWQIIGIIMLVITPISKLFFSVKTTVISFVLLIIVGLIGLVIGFKRRKLYLNSPQTTV